MTVCSQACDLAQPQFALKQAHLLVGQKVCSHCSPQTCLAWLEPLPRYSRATSLAIGQNVKIRSQNLLKEFGTKTAAIEYDGDTSLANQTAHLLQNRWEHFNQSGIGLGRDHQ
jgi:hypothetical protein